VIPTYEQLELPILAILERKGGKARPMEVYDTLLEAFPDLNEVDLSEVLASGDNKFRNRVRWVRQTLIDKGDLYSAERGVWAITEAGRARLKSNSRTSSQNKSAVVDQRTVSSLPMVPPSETSLANLEELADGYVAAFERKVLQELLDREPVEFENFAAKLLGAYGFRKISVTKTHTAPDGGIDGNGELKVGLATMRAAFQCKRWQGSVGRPEIDKFRGAIQGQFEHGYFFTTSTFSAEAREASIKSGAVPVFLFDGHEIVQIMIEKGLGITRRPIEIYEDRVDSLFDGEE
jgi:restriction system protein